jgi:hypothetical protein
MDLLKWVETILRERGILRYGISTDLLVIAPGTTVEFDQQNNYYFLANVFGSLSKAVDGEIIGADEALPIKPHVMQTMCYKHQHFTGRVSVTNNDATQTLYVEFLIASPKNA